MAKLREYEDRLKQSSQNSSKSPSSDTPEANSVLFDMVREINRLKGSDVDAANALGVVLENGANGTTWRKK
ncbi:hypothetical protein JQC92_14120 [Shewanella sp. 202IG2-18]|nr:hypothetical protein [Parashewanella hymeniacidonis]